MSVVVSLMRVKEFRRSVGFGIGAGLLSFLMMIAPGLQAQSGGQRDCDSNAVIRCGALTPAEMRQKYSSQRDVREVFNHFKINRSELMNGNWRKGHVTRDGKVVVNGKTVATNAMTAGRQNMAGSRAVTKNGTTFYVRPPGVSFSQQRLDALVLMKNGRFKSAVLTSCGNPVKAKPTPKPVAKQKKQKPQKKQVVEKKIIQQQQQQQQVIVQPPPAPPAPQPKEEAPSPVVIEEEVPAPAPPVETPAPEVLPDTGPGQALGISALVTFGGSLWYAIYAGLRNRFM